jgi:hypothetical protein
LRRTKACRVPAWLWLTRAPRVRALESARLGRYALLPALALATLALAASPAQAARLRLAESGFGPDGTATSAFERPAAIGVDQSTGQIYVEDAQATVRRFNSNHEPEPFTGIAPNIKAGVLTGFSFFIFALSQLAVNSTSHDFYVVNNESQSLRAYQSDGEPANFTAGPGAGTNEIGGFASFLAPCGVAVDSSGDIYASGREEGVKIYAPSGELITTIAGTVGSGFCNLAVDSHGVLYLNQSRGEVVKFTPSAPPPVTAATTYTAGGIVDANAAQGVAVDPATNNLLVDESTQVAEYEEAGARLLSFGAFTASEGIAVNGASGRAYVSDAEGEHRVGVFGPAIVLPEVITGAASEIGPTAATLNGTVNPEGVEVTDCHFDYGTTTSYGQSAPCEQAVGSGTGAVAVTAKLKGLTPGTSYHFRLIARNANDPSPQTVPNPGLDATLATLPPPQISAAAATGITEASANLTAKVNPGGLQLSDCHFDYGTTTSYGHSVPCVPGASEIPVDSSAHAISAAIAGLEAKNKTYHWRVVASNAAGTTTTPDHAFIYPVGSAAEASCAGLPEPERRQEELVRQERDSSRLPDCRAYELVTPPQKNGALIGEVFLSSGASLPLIAANGQRVIAPSIQCFAQAQSCVGFRNSEGEPFAFTRSGGGWATTPLTPPGTSFETSTRSNVSADAGTVLFIIPRPQSRLNDFYALSEGGSPLAIGPFGDIEGHTNLDVLAQEGLVSTADLSHVVYQTNGATWSFDQSIAGAPSSLYEYVGAGNAAPLMVGVSGGYENGKNYHLISACGTILGGASGTQTAYGTMSADGRSVYFTATGHDTATCPAGATAPPVAEIYARIDGERADARSALISTPGVCTSKECEENTGKEERFRDPSYEGASSDGSRVLFTDTQQLSDGASQSGASAPLGCEHIGGPGGCNLYESVCEGCEELGEPEEHAKRRLIDISEGAKEHGGPRVQGVMAISADGSHVYFIAKGKLTGEEENQSHEKAQEEAENLYVYSAGHLAFITALSPADEAEWHQGELTANVTPDGRFLVFTSHRALTADLTRPEGPAQVFEYDAQAKTLIRVSIGEGAFNDNGNAGTGDASIVKVLPSIGGSAPVRADPTMSDDGKFVFFSSPVALTAQALNDVPAGGEKLAQNVYSYHEGHVSLISDGKDATPEGSINRYESVELLGSDTTGSNVFFTTFDRLVPEDGDTQRDIYDAHVCSAGQPCSAPKPPPSPPCEGEACHGQAPGASAGQAPASESFAGAGNLTPIAPPPSKPKTAAQIRAEKLAKALKACRKQHGKRRVACERKARKAYGARKASRSGQATRAGSRRGGSSVRRR